MGLFLESGYDLLMVLWGVVFILGAVGFILAMNRVFSKEESRQEQLADSSEAPSLIGTH